MNDVGVYSFIENMVNNIFQAFEVQWSFTFKCDLYFHHKQCQDLIYT